MQRKLCKYKLSVSISHHSIILSLTIHFPTPIAPHSIISKKYKSVRKESILGDLSEKQIHSCTGFYSHLPLLVRKVGRVMQLGESVLPAN